MAQAKRITLPQDDPFSWLRDFASKIPDARPSMLQDLEAGKRTEIDSLNGAVVKEGEALGIPVPVNRVMTTLVKAMEERRIVLGKPYGVV